MRQSRLIGRQIILMLHNGGRNDQVENRFSFVLGPLNFSVDAFVPPAECHARAERRFSNRGRRLR